MAERMWTDTQLHAGFILFSMVQATGRCSGLHPFSCLSAFVGCIGVLAETLGVEGSAALFAENLSAKMGYDYRRIITGLQEEACRQENM